MVNSEVKETDEQTFCRMLVNAMDMEAYRLFDSTTRRVRQPCANDFVKEFYNWLIRIGWKIKSTK